MVIPEIDSTKSSPGLSLEPEPLLPDLRERSDRTIMNLAHKAAMVVDAFPDRIPNARELADMTRAFGPDLVTVSLTKILAQVSPNKYFLDRVDRIYRDLRLDGRVRDERDLLSALVPQADRAELCVIESVDDLTPGAKWGGHVETWRSWARKVGLTTDVIQTDRRNSLLANAEVIRRELALQPHDRRIIATVGRGGAEFRLLLEQLLKTSPHELEGIQMWINVAGLIRGGSGVSSRSRRWWRRKAHHLSHSNPRLRAEPELQGLPFVCVSMVGFPALAEVPVGLKVSYLEMSSSSPNDGLATFHESIIRPGYIVPVPGMSHAAESARLGPWFQAVLASFDFDRKPTPTNV